LSPDPFTVSSSLTSIFIPISSVVISVIGSSLEKTSKEFAIGIDVENLAQAFSDWGLF
jgi:hypothetical protein